MESNSKPKQTGYVLITHSRVDLSNQYTVKSLTLSDNESDRVDSGQSGNTALLYKGWNTDPKSAGEDKQAKR